MKIKGAITRAEKIQERKETLEIAKKSRKAERLIPVPNSQPTAWVAVRIGETNEQAIKRYFERVDRFVVNNANW
jgi:hypothetical protein